MIETQSTQIDEEYKELTYEVENGLEFVKIEEDEVEKPRILENIQVKFQIPCFALCNLLPLIHHLVCRCVLMMLCVVVDFVWEWQSKVKLHRDWENGLSQKPERIDSTWY